VLGVFGCVWVCVADEVIIKFIGINNYNYDFIGNTNCIQSVSNINSSSRQNINIETNKYAVDKKSFAETTINATPPKKDQAIVFESINNISQIEKSLQSAN
jgi:hypothetical protein